MNRRSLPRARRSSADRGDRDGNSQPLLAITRLGVFGLLVLALANGLFLYLAPGRAESDYAWSIKPAINAACIGAGYLAGCVATALVVFSTRRWRSLRILPLALAVLAVTVLAATVIHEDRFFWDYPPTWLWTAVYVTVPLLVLAFWRLQERAAGSRPTADQRLGRLRGRSAALGAVLAAIGGALFVAPAQVADVWPWPLTPLLARVIAGWYLLSASVLLSAAVSLRRFHEVPIAYATLGTWSALLLALPALYSGDLIDRPLAVGVWLAVHVLLLALAVSALVLTTPSLQGSEGGL